MPNLKIFARRKSGNPLEDFSPDTPASGSSFRVIERPNRAATQVYDGAEQKPVNTGRTFQSPLEQLRGKSADDLRLGVNRSVNGQQTLVANEPLKRYRGSGGTTNSGSSGYYDSSSASARHSSSSTLPSSVDQERERDNEELYPRKPNSTPMLKALGARDDAPLPPPPSFKSRAGRAFSFGQKHNSIQKDNTPPPPPAHQYAYGHGVPSAPTSPAAAHRDRSLTTSSYASTAKPPPTSREHDLNLSLGMSSFGDDFGNMFDEVGKSTNRSREELALPPMPSHFHRTESEPMYPPRTLNRQALSPSPNGLAATRENAGSPYSFDDRNSQEGLMSGSGLSSPRLLEDGPPSNGIAPAFMGRGKAGYSLVQGPASPALGRTSSDSTTSYASEDERENSKGYNRMQTQSQDDKQSRAIPLHGHGGPRVAPSFSTNSFQTSSTDQTVRGAPSATNGALRSGALSPSSDAGSSIFADSSTTTPKAAKAAIHDLHEEPLFDASPQGPPSRALRPGHERTESGTPRKLTKAQFEALQRSGESSLDHSEDEKQEEDDEDDEDEAERAQQVRRQRKKQQANMAVYRQQMKKVTGGPADLPPARPSMDRASASAPQTGAGGILHLGGMGGAPPPDTIRGKPSDDEDEDVPLGILQAHGFPSAARPPTRMTDMNDQRRMSMAGSVVNGGAGQGNLPPFARRLPADPYFGASLVNQSNRESLAFSSAQSVYGGAPAQTPPVQTSMGHPGGLVGVIASEERAKASRRGSPNPMTGQYGMPMPGQMSQIPQMPPQMPRTMSMGSIVAPQVYTPSGYAAGMPPMPMMPMMPQMMPQQDNSQQQQMQKFMEMQMQLMQNVLTMQQQQMGQTPPPLPPQQPQDYLGVPFRGDRPMSMASQAPSYHQNGVSAQGRSMTMQGPPPSWTYQSSAPRPQSHIPSSYAPSGLNVGGPGPGYTPSIAPSERSNIGMPSRYRPVNTSVDPSTGRSQSMTSSMTLQAFTNQQQRPESQSGQLKSTIRIVDKPKGLAKVTTYVADEDEEEGWTEMAKKRKEKKFSWRKKPAVTEEEPALTSLYEEYK